MKVKYKKIPSRMSRPANKFALELRALGIGFSQEYQFHPDRKWRLDFAIPYLKIGVEVHGGVHTRGRHTRGTGFTGDREKMNEALILGWAILEVTPAHIKAGKAAAWVERLIKQRKGNPYEI